MLRLQADGITGAAERLYADIGESDWLTRAGKGGEYAWERGPYYARGLLPLAFILDDPALKAKAARWTEAFLSGQRENGDFGPKADNWWANSLVMGYMRDWYLISGDERAVRFLERYADYLAARLPEHPLIADSGWARARGGDILDALLWLHGLKGDPKVLACARIVADSTADWETFYRSGERDTAYQEHIVNFNQGMKTPALLGLLRGDPAPADGYDVANDPDGWVMRRCGRPDGLVNGTEPLSSRSPTQGVELCAQVERIVSAAVEVAVRGNLRAADDMERVAYNTMPGTFSPDLKGVRYYHFLNQPKCTNERLGVAHNGEKCNSIVPSPHAGFGCCRSNCHVGWPKFVQSMWMRTADDGLAAILYGPCRVAVRVGAARREVEIAMETDYPFDGKVTVRIVRGGGRFPLAFRIPGWARRPDAGTFVREEREWKAGDLYELDFPFATDVVESGVGLATVVHGPLLYAFDPGQDEKVTADYGDGFVTRELRPKALWNYALALKPGETLPVRPVRVRPVGDCPFAPGASPLELEVPAAVSEFGMWGRFDEGGFPGQAWDPPAGPIPAPPGGVRPLRLVPIGATQLRIACFPWFSASKVK